MAKALKQLRYNEFSLKISTTKVHHLSKIRCQIFLAIVVRIILLVYGEWHDRHFILQYTDIDYHVFTDAARHMANGSSPYARETYRYTPMLAFLLLPNILLMSVWGKVLFSALDVVTGWLIYTTVKTMHLGQNAENISQISAAVWLFNPLPLVVSTRGNAEPVMSVLILVTLFCLYKRFLTLAGITYGLAIHFKLYPIIYSLPIYLSLQSSFLPENSVKRVIALLAPNRDRLVFVIVTILSFAFPTMLSAYFYGKDYIDEALFYHVVRKDIRHNFSPYFYILYLTAEWDSRVIGLLAFLPQAISVILLAFQFGRFTDLPFCLFSQTFAFVMLNKVCTSQYFLWYLCLLPLVIPNVNLNRKQWLSLTSLWLGGQGLWLFPAYLLEFQGYRIITLVFLASLVFLCINIYILKTLLAHYCSGQLKKEH